METPADGVSAAVDDKTISFGGVPPRPHVPGRGLAIWGRVISDSVSRRRVLFAVAAAPLAVACTTEPAPPPPPDPLSALAAQARADAKLAQAVATPAAAEVAKARETHATLLQAEVDRERPPLSSTAPPPVSTAPEAPDPLAALRTALDAAVRDASALVPSLPSYRAGLVGSVAAGCASLREVLA